LCRVTYFERRSLFLYKLGYFVVTGLELHLVEKLFLVALLGFEHVYLVLQVLEISPVLPDAGLHVGEVRRQFGKVDLNLDDFADIADSS